MYILLIISVLNLVVNVVTSCTCSGTNLSIDGEETCFQVVEDSGGSWSSADKKCSNLGGFLAHVTNKTLLTDLKSLVNSSSSRYMVGHVVGNVEYNMIAYMCPNNAYKSLMNDSTISQVATGNATTNSTCMFFETSDSKLHYGNCNQQSDVICQIPMETTDYCGIMCGGVTASSTVKATSNTTVPGAKTTVSGAKTIVSNSKTTVSDSKTTVSRTKDDCDCSGVTKEIDGINTCLEVQSGSGGSWKSADQKCYKSDGYLAHIRDDTMLETIQSYIKTSYKQPIMVGHVVGNAEYNLIAYMCPNNSYKSLVNNTLINETISGTSGTNETCLFIEDSDYKLHYGTCTQASDVLCEIPLENDSRCGVMKTCSSTAMPKTTLSSSQVGSFDSNNNNTKTNVKNSVNNSNSTTNSNSTSNSSTNKNSSTNGSTENSDNSNESDSTNNNSNTNSTNSASRKNITNGASSTNNNSSEDTTSNSSNNSDSQSSSSSNKSNSSSSSSTNTNSNSTSNTNSQSTRSNINSTNNNSSNNEYDSNNVMSNYDDDNPDGTYDKEETIGPSNSGKYSNDSNNEYDKNDNNNMNNNMQKSQSNMLQHSSSNSSIEDLLNQSDYNFNDTDMSFNDTNNNRSDYDMIGKFGHNQHNGHDDNNHLECYGNGYNRVGKYCVRWWIWFIVGLLILAMAICICGVGCYFCGLNMCRRNRNNIVILEQPTQSIVVEKLRPTSTITTVVETIEVIGNRHGRPSILYDVAVAETIIPEEIIPPKPYYATSPMMMIGSGEFSDRSMSLGMGDNRLYSPSDRITHENLTGPKLTLPTNGPYDERLPTGATALIPPPVVQAESDNIPSMSDGIPVRTFDRAPGRSPTPSDEDFSDGIREFNRNGIGRQGGRF